VGQGGRFPTAGRATTAATPHLWNTSKSRTRQTAICPTHLTDAIERGIGVYYTTLTVGRISFAILEDRKFKSGPAAVLPEMDVRPNRADHVSVPSYDPSMLDVPEATLLGERQLKFVRQWAADWRDCDMKAVLSQTVLAGGAHLHGSRNNRLYATGLERLASVGTKRGAD